MFPLLERCFKWVDHLLTKVTFQQTFHPVIGPAVWIFASIIYFILAGWAVPKLFAWHWVFKTIGYSSLLMLLCSYYLVHYRKRLGRMGFAIPNKRNFIWSFVLSWTVPHIFILFIALIIMLLAVYFLDIRSDEYRFTFDSLKNPAYNYIVLLQFLVLAPLAEEFFFRGIIYSSMRKKWGLFISSYVSAIIFAVAHVTMPIEDLFSGLVTFSVGIPLGPFLLGWFNALIYERSGCIWVAVILHSSLNLTGPLVQTFCPFMLDFLAVLYQ